jgi:hypothetical protein
MSDPRRPSSSNSSLSRRQALQAGAGLAAILAAGVAPRVLRAEDKAAAKARVYGTGAHTYEVVDNWAKRPENKPWGDTHMVQELADGRILIHHNGPESVHVYDPDGKFIESWGDEYKGAAHGMDLRNENGEEFLYFAPTGQHRVVKTNTKGEKVFELTYPKEAKNAAGEPCYPGDGRRFVPTFIALAPNGDFYVADGYGLSYVHRYNVNGEYQSTFGGKGKAEGQLDCPHGIWCDTRDEANPTILVADRSNHRLQWFTLDGKHIKTVTEELRDPCHFDQMGTDILIPDLNGRVTIFDKDNKLVTHLGDNPDPAKRRNHGVKKEELVPGEFCTPHGAIWDRAGNIYVAEWLPYGRVTKLRRVAA